MLLSFLDELKEIHLNNQSQFEEDEYGVISSNKNTQSDNLLNFYLIIFIIMDMYPTNFISNIAANFVTFSKVKVNEQSQERD